MHLLKCFSLSLKALRLAARSLTVRVGKSEALIATHNILSDHLNPAAFALAHFQFHLGTAEQYLECKSLT